MSTEGLEKKRDLSIDVAKGIGILAVIAGHTGLDMVGTFHMAFFFLLSGYFMSSKLPMKEFIQKRVKQLLIPYAFGVILSVAVDVLRDICVGDYTSVIPDAKKWIIAGLYGKGTNKDMLFDGVEKIGAYWFLLAIFIGSIIVRKYIDNKYMIVIVAIIALVGWGTRQVIFLPLSIQNGLVASFFIGAGVYARKLDIFHRKCNIFLMLGMIALWIFAIIFKIQYSMVNIKFTYGILNIIVAFSASYIVVKCSQLIESKTNLLRRILAFYGENSLIVLVFHALEINVIKWSWCYEMAEKLGLGGFGGVAFSCICRTVFCTIGVLVANKSKLLRKIFSK